MATADSSDYAKVSTAAVRAMAKTDNADFEIFLPRSSDEDPLLYRKAGKNIAAPDFDRLNDHHVSYLYVRAEDLQACELALEEKLSAILENPDVTPDDKAEIVHTAGVSVARDIVEDAAAPQGINRAARLIDSMIGSVLTDPLVSTYLLQMASHERTTASHMFVVSTLAVMLGAEVFGKDIDLLRSLGVAGMLHDIGKLSISPDILNKAAPLTREEIQLVQQHPIESVRLIGQDPDVTPTSRQIIVQHHERVDGRGYPLGASRAELHPGSRLVTIVDSFHALIGRRSYRAALTVGEANRVLATQAGRQFDEEILARWIDLCERYSANMLPQPPRPAPESGEAVASRYEHAATPPRPGVVGQRSPRYACRGNAIVQCVYAGRLRDVSTAPDEFGACVHDVSRGGVCICTAHPMYRGEIVNVRVKTVSERFWLRSMVAWCRQVDTNVYKTGLRFLDRLNEQEVHEIAEVAPMGNVTDRAPQEEPPACSGPAAGDKPSGSKPAVDVSAPIREKREDALTRLAAIAAMRKPNAESQRIAVTFAMSGDVKVRLKALDVLLRIPTQACRDALMTLLDDQNLEVRERAITAVGHAKIAEAIGPLQRLLRDRHVTIGLRAAGALGLLGDHSGLKLVEQALKRRTGPELRVAVMALSDITGHRFSANREGIQSARRYLAAGGHVCT